LKDKLDARRQEILMDLPQALSKLTLLINSGMVVRDAWKRTAITGTRQLYIEMQQTSLEIENGVMEIEAYRNFAERCGVKEVKKFSTLIIQNLKKGNEELAMFLNDLSDEMWEMKKNEVKQKGEKANSKLLLPVFLIFIGILILVLVPMMNGMG
jgi:tight adherence protein C